MELFDILWAIDSINSRREMIQRIRPFAEVGDPGAMARLGRAYRDGKGVEKNLELAAEWMRKAADKDLWWAKLELAQIILKNNKTTDKKESFNLFKQLSEKGNTFATQQLSMMYYRGIGTTKSKQNAIDALCNCKDMMSQLQLADIYSYSETEEERNIASTICNMYATSNDSARIRKQIWNLEKRITEINKITPDGPINIWLVSSDEYAKYASVLIKSIVDTNSTRKIVFYIMTSGISKNNKKLITCHASPTVDIKFIISDDRLFNKIKFPDTGFNAARWVKSILCKLIPNHVLPNDVDRILYLGVDTIVRSSLDDLYYIDLDNYYVAGAGTATTYANIFSNKYLKNNIMPINGDVILFNVKKFRENNISIESYENYYNRYHTEEELLPALFKDQVKYLDTYLWNYRFDAVYEGITKHGILEPEPVIYHYVSYVKPWSFYIETDQDCGIFSSCLRMSYDYNNTMKDWWDVAIKCPHYHELITNMRIQRATLAMHGQRFLELLEAKNHFNDNIIHLLTNTSQYSLLKEDLIQYDEIIITGDTDGYYRKMLNSLGIVTNGSLKNIKHENILELICDDKETPKTNYFINIKDLLERYNLQ